MGGNVPLRVGFVGLGNIGLPMARNIAGRGFALTVFDLRAEPLAAAAKHGAAVARTLREVAAGAEIIGVCVRDDAEVERVLLGTEGILAAAGPSTIVVIHSTVHPRTVHDMARHAARRGVEVLDVPITGGAAGAEAKTLCYMAGGDAELIARCRPVFETSAARIVHTGALGTGAATKLCNNIMMYLGFLAAFEATSLAQAAGMAREVLLDVTRANGVLTKPMEAYLGLRATATGRADDQAFQHMLAGFTDLAAKDLEIALACARELDVALPGTERCRELMALVYGGSPSRNAPPRRQDGP